MTDNLFDSDDSLQRLPLAGADVEYLRRVPLPEHPDILMRRLLDEVPWRCEEVVVWGKRHLQPRLIAWFGDAGKSYAYSGIQMDPLPWNDTLLTVKNQIENIAATRFNSVLLNYYRNERDSMGFHSDDERELGPRPVIASLSLGASRTFVFKSKLQTGEGDVKVLLGSGSLLLMRGDTQRNWKHGIPKTTRPCGPRINLTFRQILSTT